LAKTDAARWVYLDSCREETETVAPGQVHFFKSNTPHGFKNPGATAVTFMEIFVKNTGRAGGITADAI
jgi:quercetin dioxygenase-like cupin family protein